MWAVWHHHEFDTVAVLHAWRSMDSNDDNIRRFSQWRVKPIVYGFLNFCFLAPLQDWRQKFLNISNREWKCSWGHASERLQMHLLVEVI